MRLEVLLVHDLHFCESPLPNFSLIAKFVREAMRKPALDELHGLFDGHFVTNLDEKMDVIGHHNITYDNETIALARFLQNAHKQIAASGAREPGLPVIAAAGEIVQMVLPVVALQPFGHGPHCMGGVARLDRG